MALLSGTPHKGRGVEPTHLPSEPLPVVQLGWVCLPAPLFELYIHAF